MDRIYLSPPHMTGTEQKHLAEAFADNWIAPVGPQLNEFEARLSTRIGVKHSLAVSSGTAALHLILRSLELEPGDEVICSTLTFCATANPIVYEKANPVFIDSEPHSWNMDPNLLSEELAESDRRGKLPRAIIAVDIFGQSADMDAIVQIASKYEIPVIEDAAEALGSTYKDRSVGSSGWASFFSFNGNKIITTSGGGAICSDDEQLVERCRHLSTQARDPAPWYQHSEVGFNYRMSNVLAGIGLGQLESLDSLVEARRANCEAYRSELESIDGISFMPEASFGRMNRWLTVLQLDPSRFGATPEQLRVHLESDNIESRHVWKPLHMQPAYSRYRAKGGEVAEQLFKNGICLPSGSTLTESQRQRVIDGIRSVAKHCQSAA